MAAKFPLNFAIVVLLYSTTILPAGAVKEITNRVYAKVGNLQITHHPDLQSCSISFLMNGTTSALFHYRNKLMYLELSRPEWAFKVGDKMELMLTSPKGNLWSIDFKVQFPNKLTSEVLPEELVSSLYGSSPFRITYNQQDFAYWHGSKGDETTLLGEAIDRLKECYQERIEKKSVTKPPTLEKVESSTEYYLKQKQKIEDLLAKSQERDEQIARHQQEREERNKATKPAAVVDNILEDFRRQQKDFDEQSKTDGTKAAAKAADLEKQLAEIKARTEAKMVVAKPELKPVKFYTGVLKRKKGREGIAPFKIETPEDRDYMVTLVNVTDKINTEAVVLTITRKSEFTTKIPLGTYRIYAAYGQTWYGKKNRFGPETVYAQQLRPDGSEEFEFSKDPPKNGKSITHGHSLRFRVSDGNSKSKTIGGGEFPDDEDD
ncbi:hypothetical protein ACVWZV_000115 [Bradyrhizobium sp. GM5.1]